MSRDQEQQIVLDEDEAPRALLIDPILLTDSRMEERELQLDLVAAHLIASQSSQITIKS
jgi:hypothetical protein